MRNGLVEGKIALVTGAGSGIGRATAIKFALEGAKVVVSDINPEGGAETLQLIKEGGGDGVFVKTDVSKGKDVEIMVKTAVEIYGRLDCAHNNAGVGGQFAGLANCTEENFDRVMSINLKGVWFCMKTEIEQMLSQGGGAIVNTASAGGLMASRFVSDYVTSKHAVVGLTKAAAIEYVIRNIRVNCVCPGIVNTPLSAQMKADESIAAMMAATQPPNRFAEPEEIANAVVWLCSDEASFVNGHALAVDGGQTVEIMKLPKEFTEMFV